jgi:hypothetical protein
MASGHLALILLEDAGWEGFEAFACGLVERLGGEVLERNDTPVERVWSVRIGAAAVWLAYDDAFARYELNARDAEGDALVLKLATTLGG